MNKFWLKMLIILSLGFQVFGLFLVSDSYAQTASSSGEVKAEAIASSSSDLKSKIKALQDEIASKASQLKNEISDKLQNKAYIGLLKNYDDNSATITYLGDDLSIKINQYTQYSGKKITNLKSFSNGDYVAALGDVDDNDILTAKRLIKLPDAKPPNKKAILGTIISVTDRTLSIQASDNKSYVINVKPTTTFQSADSQISFSALKATRQVIIVVEDVSASPLTARFVDLLPSGYIQSNLTASSSADKK